MYKTRVEMGEITSCKELSFQGNLEFYISEVKTLLIQQGSKLAVISNILQL